MRKNSGPLGDAKTFEEERESSRCIGSSDDNSPMRKLLESSSFRAKDEYTSISSISFIRSYVEIYRGEVKILDLI